MRVQCPHCHTSYTASRCGIPEEAGVEFVVVCMVCQQAFHGDVEERAIVTNEAMPASLLHRLTFQQFGQPAVAATTEPVWVANTRKR